MSDPLESFSPVTRTWFREKFGQPTPPQAQGWLPIQRGDHTLILAPTGSGKTLAAFLWGIDRLYRELDQGRTTKDERRRTDDDTRQTTKGEPRTANASSRRSSLLHPSSFRLHPSSEGVHLLYISPLKALNNDIERNLRVPMEGIRETAARLNTPIPHLRVAVRTGDTPASVRAAMLRHPPHILITTPESLYLMLTSPRARELFRTVRTVIVDEIHTLAGNKRGAHLAVSLERLQHLAHQRVQRIGLSATIKPLDEVARFLGGQEQLEDEGRTTKDQGQEQGIRRSSFVVRSVTVVDARYHKPLDLEIVSVVDDFRSMPSGSIWAYVVPQVLFDIRRHDTTLIFANNRRLAERTADRLNAQLEAEQSEEIPPGSPEALAPGGRMRDRGIFAIGAQGPIRAHHGSMSKEARRQMEEDLKAGKLPALVGTSSLELGIDIGAVDLVVQLQSPKSVAQGLQRVGRSGHLVGQTSHGKIYATFREDLAEAAAIARGMLEGDVEPTHTPQNPLDVLAQHIVAMVAMEDWDVDALYNVVRGAYPYRDLAISTFIAVLEMLTGKYYIENPALRAVSSLRAKISWDRVHNRLTALPGSRLLAISNVGTIPDTGAYGVYLSDGKTKVGELDEEFVLETRPGDVFMLGSTVWRAMDIKEDRVLVVDAAGATPRMPFWRGDYPWRPYELGERIGTFRREVAERVKRDTSGQETDKRAERFKIEDWLEREYRLDENSARNLLDYVKSQLDIFGDISSDRTIIVESFQNAVGDPHLVIHSPFGGRVNGAWALALSSALRERTGTSPEAMSNDDGIILRFSQSDQEPPIEIVSELTANDARERILRELPDSAVFGAQFRMNAARALLITKPRAGKRTPFWLQRLKAKDLLAYVKRFPDFPILVETYRDCLRDVFDMPHLEQVLNHIASGEIRVVPHESVVPSPIAAGLLFNFTAQYLYEWDAPKAERQMQLLAMPREALQQVLQGVELSELLKPDAIAEVVRRAQHLAPGYQARTVEELALILQELGDLTTDEIVARCSGDGQAWIQELAQSGRIVEVEIATLSGKEMRWVSVELLPILQGVQLGGLTTLQRFLRSSGPVTREDILQRYAFDADWLDNALSTLVAAHELVRSHFTSHVRDEYCDAHLLEQIHRRTLTLLRQQVQPVSVFAYADFLTRWQHLHPATRDKGTDGLREVLKQLRGVALPGVVWERDVLPARLRSYTPDDLDTLSGEEQLVWVGAGLDAKRGRIRFFTRGEGALFLDAPADQDLSADARRVRDFLKEEGASFATDIQTGLKLNSDALATALVELVTSGLVTNDEIETLREIIEHGTVGRIAPAPPRKSMSALESELAARLGPRPVKQTQYRAMKQRVGERIRAQLANKPSPWRGRWSLVHRAGVTGAPLTEQERAEKLAMVLLQRYGVVTREVLANEAETGDWRLAYEAWQLMEMRGQVRRGYFVAGLSGVQYALPDAVEQLRAASTTDDDSLIVLNATDPANLFGSLGDGLRFARVPSTYAILWRGQPILVAEENGERLAALANIPNDLTASALREFFTRPSAPRHVVVTEWNGDKILGSPGEELLKPLGFYRVPKGLERWRER